MFSDHRSFMLWRQLFAPSQSCAIAFIQRRRHRSFLQQPFVSLDPSQLAEDRHEAFVFMPLRLRSGTW